MKRSQLAGTLLAGILPALVTLSPVVLADGSVDEHRSIQSDRQWTIPPINKQWGIPQRSSHWTIPPINKQWGIPQRSGNWTIPRTADDMLSPGTRRDTPGSRD